MELLSRKNKTEDDVIIDIKKKIDVVLPSVIQMDNASFLNEIEKNEKPMKYLPHTKIIKIND